MLDGRPDVKRSGGQAIFVYSYLGKTWTKFIIDNSFASMHPCIFASNFSLPSCHPVVYSSEQAPVSVIADRKADPQSQNSEMLKHGGQSDILDNTNPLPQSLPRGREVKISSSRFTLHPSLKKRAAFTLAEVLITLGIIGVVASLTIPSLVSNYKKKQTVSQLQKLYSTMNQAVNLSKANDTWTSIPYNDIVGQATINWFKTALVPYLNGAEFPADIEYPNSTLNNTYLKILLSDGTICFFRNTQQIHTFCDINGLRGPNKDGVDLFYFFLDYEVKNSSMRSSGMGNFYPAGFFGTNNDNDEYTEGYAYNDREKMVKHCNPANNVGLTNTCALLIMFDGWQIKKDYPVRIR